MTKNEEKNIQSVRNTIDGFNRALIKLAEFQRTCITETKGTSDETIQRINRCRSAVVNLLSELNTLEFDVVFRQLNSDIGKPN